MVAAAAASAAMLAALPAALDEAAMRREFLAPGDRDVMCDGRRLTACEVSPGGSACSVSAGTLCARARRLGHRCGDRAERRPGASARSASGVLFHQQDTVSVVCRPGGVAANCEPVEEPAAVARAEDAAAAACLRAPSSLAGPGDGELLSPLQCRVCRGAGVLVSRVAAGGVEVLLGVDARSAKLGPLGGARDALEAPLETALREFREETGDRLSAQCARSVAAAVSGACWVSKGDYAWYTVPLERLSSAEQREVADLPATFASWRTSAGSEAAPRTWREMRGLRWVSLRQLVEWKPTAKLAGSWPSRWLMHMVGVPDFAAWARLRLARAAAGRR